MCRPPPLAGLIRHVTFGADVPPPLAGVRPPRPWRRVARWSGVPARPPTQSRALRHTDEWGDSASRAHVALFFFFKQKTAYEMVATSRWPKIPNFVYASATALPAPALSDFDLQDTAPRDRAQRRNWRDAEWSRHVTLVLSPPLLPVPA